MRHNLIIDTDSYKCSHWLQYPPGTESTFFYLESRGGRYDETVFFGLQYILKEYLSKPVTMEDVEEAKKFIEAHGEPFNYEGWKYIVEEHGGYIPLKIKAVPEGSIIPNHNVLLTAETTDPKAFWVGSWFETIMMRLWYPITVATQSFHIKKDILEYLERTADAPLEEINFKLHDFGSRGVSSSESAAVGGAAHLVNFMGSDTMVGVRMANQYYNHEMAAFSIPAAEHSTMTTWGPEGELDAYRNMLKQFAKPGSIVAVVSDSYDLFRAVKEIWGGELKEEIIKSGATVVVRPDSGDPAPIVLKTIQLLEESFGTTINTKGYKVLPSCIRVIQGDGINQESICEILDTIIDEGYSASNVTFGMGGALLQKLDRDTQKFAYKVCSVVVNGEQRDTYKDPVTDPGKRSKSGRLQLIKFNGEYSTVKQDFDIVEPSNVEKVMRTVFNNGQLFNETTLDEIRTRVNEHSKK